MSEKTDELQKAVELERTIREKEIGELKVRMADFDVNHQVSCGPFISRLVQ